ncbi:MAG: FtsW/RodA/SpoVE family cell cycle protein [Muribaculaceae bacterium]|nr:FtsW/RodA/SpoVE family cell cycle protein [Muribaculaceae bacterium]
MARDKRKYDEIARKHGDPWIWGIYFMLLIISVVESYSASSQEVAKEGVYMPMIKHNLFLLAGLGIVFFLKRIDYNNKTLLAVMIPLLGVVTLFSLVYVMFGPVINNAKRAIVLPGGFTFQPVELAKLSIVTLLAYILARNQKNKDVSTKGVIIAVAIVTLYSGLMFRSGLTNTLLLMTISLSMVLIGGLKFKKFFALLGMYAIIAFGYMTLSSHNDKMEANLQQDNGAIAMVDEGDKSKEVDRSGTWASRVSFWKESNNLVYQKLNDQNAQAMLSRMAQAHGGLTGVGLGNSRECSRLPLAFSDYIYSIIVEETGLIGGIFIIVLFMWLLARAAMIARKCRRVLPALLIIGMASLIAYQALFHMAINSGLFPVSGQPLPLISKGGTSILAISVAFGIMLSVSRTIANQNNKNSKTEDDKLPAGLDAENPTQLIRPNEWK